MNEATFGIRLRADMGEASNISQAQAALDKLRDSVGQTNTTLQNSSAEVQKLLDKYDPLGAKLKQLKADFAALDQAAKAGNFGAVDDSRIEAAYAKIKQGMNESADAADKSAFATAGARRELIILGHEAINGNFSRMPGSFMVLAERMRMTSALFSPLTLGIVGASVGAAILFKAFADGHKEQEAMNNALALSSNFAGQTQASMLSLASEMSHVGTMTIGTSKEIVTALVASGQIGAQAIGSVAKLAGDYAAATGEDISKIAPKLVKLFEDPARGAAELNKSMNFLSAADLEYIDHLVRIGELSEAQLVLSQKLEDHIPKHAQNLGSLEKAWVSVKQAAGEAWDAMLSIGKDQTLDEKIKALQYSLESGNYRQGAWGNDAIANTQKMAIEMQLAVLQAQKLAESGKAAADSAAGLANKAQIAATALVNQTSEYKKIRDIQDEIVNIQKNSPEGQDKVQALINLNKQIRALQDSMSADSRAAQKASLDADLAAIKENEKLQESAIKDRVEQGELSERAGIEAVRDLRIKALQEEFADQQKLLDTTKNNAAERTRVIQTMTATVYALAQAGTDASIAIDKLDTQTAAKIEEAVLKSRADNIAALEKETAKITEETEKQHEHNVELVQGKDALEQLKIERIDATIAQEQGLLVIAEEIDQNGAAAVALRNYIAALKEQKGVQGETITANAAKKSQEEWKKAGDEIERTLSDALMRGFEAGKSFGKNFLDSLTHSLETAGLRIVVKAMVDPVMGTLQSALGVPSTGSSLLSNANGANSASNLWSSFSKSGMGQSLGLSDAGSSLWAASSASTAASYGTAAGVAAPAWGSGTAALAADGTVTAVAAEGATLMSTLAAAAPYVAAAVVIANALGAFGKGGGPQQGQYGSISGSSAYASSFTMSGGDTLGNQALSTSIMAQISAIATAAGKTAADITINQGYKLDPQGSAAGLAYRSISVAGSKISGGNFDGNNGADYVTSHDNAAGVATYLGTLHTSELQALITSLGDPKLIAASQALMANYGELEKSLPAYLTATAMQKAMSQSMMTDAEKLADTTKTMTAGFDALGIAVPKSTEEFQALIDKIDPTTTAAQNELVALNNLEPAFLQVAAATTTATTAMDASAKSLAQIASERQQWQDQLDNLTLTSAQLFEKQRAALDASNQSLFDQVQSATAAKTATDAAASVAQQQHDMNIQLLQAQGNTTAATVAQHADALAALDPSLRATQQAIWDATDAATAQAKAAQDAAAATAAQAAASQQAAQAAQAAKASLDAMSASIKSAVSGLLGQTAVGAAMSYSSAKSTLASMITSMAGGGATPDSATLQNTLAALKTSTTGFSTLQDYQSEIMSTAGMLQSLGNLIDKRSGSIPAYASGGDHPGGWAIVGEQGPELINLPQSTIFNSTKSSQMLDNSALIAEVRALRGEVASLRKSSETSATSNKKLTDLMWNISQDGLSLRTRLA